MNYIELNTLLSSLLMELFRDNEPNNFNGTLQGYDSQLVGGESVGYHTSVAKDLNSGLTRTNPTSGQSGIDLGASRLQFHPSNHSSTSSFLQTSTKALYYWWEASALYGATLALLYRLIFFFMICLHRCLPISSEAQLGLPSKLVKAALPVTMFDF